MVARKSAKKCKWKVQSAIYWSPRWQIKIVMACLQTVLRNKSQNVGNSPKCSSSPTQAFMHLLSSSPQFLSAVFSSPVAKFINENIQVQSSKWKFQIWTLPSSLRLMQVPSVWTLILSACDSAVWKDTFLTIDRVVPMQYLDFFLTSTETPALRGSYVYSRHAKQALCWLESSCQCLLVFSVLSRHFSSMSFYGHVSGARAWFFVVVVLGTTQP